MPAIEKLNTELYRVDGKLIAVPPGSMDGLPHHDLAFRLIAIMEEARKSKEANGTEGSER